MPIIETLTQLQERTVFLMLDVTQFLYHEIGDRVKAMRKRHNSTQQHFCCYTLDNQINISALSRIENGKNDKHKNPYLLSPAQIEILCEFQNCSPSMLIWGNNTEKEEFVKLLLLALLMNSDKITPFEKQDLDAWAVQEMQINPQWENNLSSRLSQQELHPYLFAHFGYFFQAQNEIRYARLHNHFDPAYEKTSNLLLKLLLTDYAFSNNFISHLIHYTQNMSGIQPDADQTNAVKSLIRDFVTNKGEYSVIMLDNKSKDYVLFIHAFESFWKKHKSHYLDFFHTHLFSLVDDTDGAVNDLKHLQNQTFHSILTSDAFAQLNEELLLLSDYEDNNSILATLNFRLQLQQAMQTNLFVNGQTDKEFLQCLNEIKNMTTDKVKNYFHKLPKES